MKLLITGFDAFGKDKINPSSLAIQQLANNINDIKIIKKQLPTKFDESIIALDKYVKDYNPDIIICVGQAAGRSKISLEKVGLNLRDAKICDNANYQPQDETIYQDGDLAYFSNLPLKSILADLKSENVAAEISYTAGTFVCNNVLYHLLYLINKKAYNFKAGFIHIPLISEQLADQKEKVFVTELSEIIKALTIVIQGLSQNNVTI